MCSCLRMMVIVCWWVLIRVEAYGILVLFLIFSAIKFLWYLILPAYGIVYISLLSYLASLHNCRCLVQFQIHINPRVATGTLRIMPLHASCLLPRYHRSISETSPWDFFLFCLGRVSLSKPTTTLCVAWMWSVIWKDFDIMLESQT